MAIETKQNQINKLIEEFNGKNGLEIEELTEDRIKLRVGDLLIDTLPAKAPLEEWAGELKLVVEDARGAFDETWGSVPATDILDDISYVDCVWIFSREEDRENRDRAREGLTMRTVYFHPQVLDDPNLRFDDWRFHKGPDGRPLRDWHADKFYNGDLKKADELTVAASRLAPIRVVDMSGVLDKRRRRNEFTPEAFSTLRLKSAHRAFLQGKAEVINTMRPDMRWNVLQLEPTKIGQTGIAYEHILSDDAFGLPRGSIRTNRNPNTPDGDWTLLHFFKYEGYFAHTPDLRKFWSNVFKDLPLNISHPDFPAALSRVTDLVRPGVLEHLKAPEFKRFSHLFDLSGEICNGWTVEDLKKAFGDHKIIGDGARSYTMSLMESMRESLRLLSHSAQARDPEIRAKYDAESRRLNDQIALSIANKIG